MTFWVGIYWGNYIYWEGVTVLYGCKSGAREEEGVRIGGEEVLTILLVITLTITSFSNYKGGGRGRRPGGRAGRMIRRRRRPRRMRRRPRIGRRAFTVFKISSERGGLNGKAESSSLVIMGMSGAGGGICVTSICESYCMRVRNRNLSGVARTRSFKKPRLTVSALGAGFSLSVRGCVAIGFVGMTRLISSVSKVRRSVARRRAGCVGNCVSRLGKVEKASSTRVARTNACALSKARTITFDHVHCARKKSCGEDREREAILFGVFSGTRRLSGTGGVSVTGDVLSGVGAGCLRDRMLHLLDGVARCGIRTVSTFPGMFCSNGVSNIFCRIPIALGSVDARVRAFLCPARACAPSRAIRSVDTRRDTMTPATGGSFARRWRLRLG